MDIHFTHTLRHTFKTVDILSRKTVDILSRTNSDVDSRTHTINTSAQTKHTRDFQTKPTRDFPDTIRLEYIMSDTGWRSVIGCLIIIGLFCKRALQNRRYSAKETYYLIDPTYEKIMSHKQNTPETLRIIPDYPHTITHTQYFRTNTPETLNIQSHTPSKDLQWLLYDPQYIRTNTLKTFRRHSHTINTSTQTHWRL